MNSNPRLVTVGGTITSQIHDVRATIAKAIFIANIILHFFPRQLMRLLHLCAHAKQPFYPFQTFFRICFRTLVRRSIRSIRFTSSYKSHTRDPRSVLTAPLIKQIILTILRPLPALSNKVIVRFLLEFYAPVITDGCITLRRSSTAPPEYMKETRANNYVHARVMFNDSTVPIFSWKIRNFSQSEPLCSL